ncbi:MAG: flagellar biosynthetic protein FliR [Arcobacteraceae bacterium]|jgi:flagellar biosynthetic protein FliR|nr:flagellar biosynthetic protein FliR [Arcobacteraceae bacterium]
MESLVQLIDQNTTYTFLLLFGRILAFVALMPVFGHVSVPASIRVGIAFYFSIFLFPLVDRAAVNVPNDVVFLQSLLGEMLLGFVASMLVQIIFSAVQIIGDLIGYATTLSMANMFDPTTGTQQGVMSRFLYMVVLVLYFQSGMYEVTILMLAKSIGMITLGEFNLFNYDILSMAIKEINHMFIFAFSFSFPLFFIAFILDVYYGYGTKSMPAFSPFVLTFQIKFTLIFIFMMLGLDIFATSFEQYFIDKFN